MENLGGRSEIDIDDEDDSPRTIAASFFDFSFELNRTTYLSNSFWNFFSAPHYSLSTFTSSF